MKMQLSSHFSLEELTISQVAARYGIDNHPAPEIIGNLKWLAERLEEVRQALGDKAIHITSGYRSVGLNLTVHGSKHSAHMRGLAADLICPEYGTPIEICRAVAKSAIEYDQIIYENDWMHFAVAGPEGEGRRMLMTARFEPEGTVYLEGLLNGRDG